MPISDILSTPQRILRTSQLNRIAILPNDMPIPPPPSFMPPPPPPPSLGRKRQRSGLISLKHTHPPTHEAEDGDANYIVYLSDSEDEHHDEPRLPESTGDYDDGVETPRNADPKSGGDSFMISDTEFSEDQEPQRKRARAGNQDGEYIGGDTSDDADSDGSSAGSGEDGRDAFNMNDSPLETGAKSRRRISQKWRQDVYKPEASGDSDDSDLNLNDLTPRKKRGKRKSVGKAGGADAKKPVDVASGLKRNKSKSTPNLRPENADASNTRPSRFYEGSMNDRLTRPGGVPPFKNFQPAGETAGDSNIPTYNSFGMLQSSSTTSMPPPPRPIVRASTMSQSTPPPPKTKFTFFAPISNWFSKRWQKATQEYEERERKKEQEAEVQKQVRLIIERKAKAEKLYAENKLKGINQPTLVAPRANQEPLVTEGQIFQYMDPLRRSDSPPADSAGPDIGVAFTTNDIYAAPVTNESTVSMVTIKPIAEPQEALPQSSAGAPGTVIAGEVARSSVLNATGFRDYRDADPRDGTPLTTDTTEPDVEGLRSRSRSPVPVSIRPLTKAEQKKKERIEKKMEELKRKLAEAELDLSQVIGEPPVSAEALASSAQTGAAAKKTVGADGVDDTIFIHEDGAGEEDEAAKIVECVMGEPEVVVAVSARERSKSPFKKLFNIGGAASKKSKDASESTLHNVNDSAKIKKPSPASMRGRSGGRGGRGGKLVSKQRRDTSEDPI